MPAQIEILRARFCNGRRCEVGEIVVVDDLAALEIVDAGAGHLVNPDELRALRERVRAAGHELAAKHNSPASRNASWARK